MKEAAAEISLRNQEEMSKVKEVFEHEKYESLSRTWKVAGFVLCSAPTIVAPGEFTLCVLHVALSQSGHDVYYYFSSLYLAHLLSLKNYIS